MSKNFIPVYTVPTGSSLNQLCMQKQSKPPVKYMLFREFDTTALLTYSTAEGDNALA